MRWRCIKRAHFVASNRSTSLGTQVALRWRGISDEQQSEQQRFHDSEYKLYVAEHYASREFLSDLKREITDPLRDRGRRIDHVFHPNRD
jgi:hypothetical protein